MVSQFPFVYLADERDLELAVLDVLLSSKRYNRNPIYVQ